MSAPLTDVELARLRDRIERSNAMPGGADVAYAVLALLDEVEAARRERYTLRELVDEFGGEPVCDGSGWTGKWLYEENQSWKAERCPGCSACHKNGGGGEATISNAAPASPAAVREAVGTVTERAAEAVALALYGEGSWPPNAATGHTLVAEVEAVVDALAAAGLLRPEPWTTHDGEGRRWQVEPSTEALLAWSHETGVPFTVRVRPLPTEEADRG